MKNPDKIKQYWLSYVAAIIALIALGFSLMRVIPCEVTTETFIGILAPILGLLITLGIGLQVWNVIEWKSGLKK